MLETIFSWINNAIGEAVSAFIVAVLGALELGTREFINAFPIVAYSYQVFRVIGVVFVVFIAAHAIFQIFLGSATAQNIESPVRIGARALFSIALIFFGGYFIDMFVNLANVPYRAFLTMQDIATDSVNTFDASKVVEDATTILVANNIALPATLLINFVLLLLIAWNLLKLLLEVIQRYMTVFLLEFTSPLVFPLLASASTVQMFRNWIGMFFSSCTMMFLSVWSMQVVLSGFTSVTSGGEAGGYLIRLMLVLAFCNLAQKMDSYMQQLGFGTAATGSNIGTQLVGMALLGSRLGRHAGSSSTTGNRNSVLGESVQNIGNRMAHPGGVVGAGLGALRGGAVGAMRAAKGMGTAGEVLSEAKKGAMDEFMKNDALVGENGLRGGIMAAGGKVADKFNALKNEATYNQPDKGMPNKDAADAAIAQQNKYGKGHYANNAIPQDLKDSAAQAGKSPMDYINANVDNLGAGSIEMDGAGEFQLDARALDSGLHLESSDDGGYAHIEGTSKALSDNIGRNYGYEGGVFDYPEAMRIYEETSNGVDGETAIDTLMNPKYQMTGTGKWDRVGSNLLDRSFGKDGLVSDKMDGTGFTNVNADTLDNGGRSVTAGYIDKDGRNSGVEVLDDRAYSQLSPKEQGEYREVKAADGRTYHAKSMNGEALSELQQRNHAEGLRNNTARTDDLGVTREMTTSEIGDDGKARTTTIEASQAYRPCDVGSSTIETESTSSMGTSSGGYSGGEIITESVDFSDVKEIPRPENTRSKVVNLTDSGQGADNKAPLQKPAGNPNGSMNTSTNNKIAPSNNRQIKVADTNNNKPPKGK